MSRVPGRGQIFTVPTRAGNVLNVGFMLETGISYNAYINNHLTTGVDPTRKFSISAWMTGTYCFKSFRPEDLNVSFQEKWVFDNQ